jgi:predicted nucleic acid-binding protein
VTIVVDASIAIAWCLKDEASPLADAVLGLLATDVAIVPVIWSLEVSNSLVTAEKRGRIGSGEIPVVLDFLRRLPVSVRATDWRSEVESLIQLARQTNLTVYDASYLHLALGTGLPLATLDGPMQAAARKTGGRLVVL